MDDFASRIAQRTLAEREAGYAGEVRSLLDAALAVMRDRGIASRPRVSDIVAAAGLSNDAFYRHFKSKDALVAAILEDGTERLTSYVAGRMGREAEPAEKVRCWVRGVLSQASEDAAATTRAVLWNTGRAAASSSDRPPSATAPLAALLHGPFTEMGSGEPEFDAALVAHAVVGSLADHLWTGRSATDSDIARTAAFCFRAIGAPDGGPTRHDPKRQVRRATL